METENSQTIDTLIQVFDKGQYETKHIKSLLSYFVDIYESNLVARKAIILLLKNCKEEIVCEPLIDVLKNKNIAEEIRTDVLAICWESSLDYNQYLNVFVDILINEGDMIALEASTIITEFESIKNKKDLLEAIETIHQTKQENYSSTRRIIINDTLQHLILINSK